MKVNKSNRLKLTAIIFLAIVIVSISLSLYCINSETNSDIDDISKFDYALILGHSFNDGKMSEDLLLRLETAYEKLKDNDIPIIVSGGTSKEEWVTQGEAMNKYLMAKGIDGERIIVEKESASTRENMFFSNRVLKKEKKIVKINEDLKVVIFTSDYHMFRSKMLARHIGWEVEGVSAKHTNLERIPYMFRECLALIKDFIINKLSNICVSCVSNLCFALANAPKVS